MIIYTLIGTLAGLVAYILLAVRTKKGEDVVYGVLDKVGRITNILLIPLYVYLSPLYLGLGLVSYPGYDGFLGLVGWIICIIIASAGMLCGLGLGFSVYLRKKGRSKLSFAVQFAGAVGIALAAALYTLCAGNIVASLN